MKILVDFHHSSLLRSLITLFEDRLDYEVYRPIGMEWFTKGYWQVNKQADTAVQYLGLDQAYIPGDGTPQLNQTNGPVVKEKGVYYCKDPDGIRLNRACTLDFFERNQFDIVIASIPAHIPVFKRLIRNYNPKAKLIVQMGNEWPLEYWKDNNVLASVKKREVPVDCNAIFYHQEFDLSIFKPQPIKPNGNIYSFINVLSSFKRAQADFEALELLLPDFNLKSFGGQCRDGNMNGEAELANKINESQFVFHVKDHGDGYGHVIHNAYALGRPVITRSSDYKGKLAEELLVDSTFIDLDKYNYPQVIKIIRDLTENPDRLATMSEEQTSRFNKIINFERESKDIERWLTTLK